LVGVGRSRPRIACAGQTNRRSDALYQDQCGFRLCSLRSLHWSAARIARRASNPETLGVSPNCNARYGYFPSVGAVDMASKKRGLPKNSSVVIPRLFCRDPAKQIDFCAGTFDAIELGRRQGPDGGVVHALLTIASEMIMIDGEWPTLPSRAPALDGSSPVVIFLYVEDVDEVVERAVALGAEVIVPARISSGEIASLG